AHYLSTRLPEAPEEVADPHNLLVKYAAELGLVGLLLGLAWLGRLAWELTRPVGPTAAPEQLPSAKARVGAMPRASAIKVVSVIAGLAIAINVLANLDLATGTLDGGDLLLDGLRRAMMLAVILIGATAAAVRSLKAPDVDERPTPLVLYAILAGLAVFVLHNLLDFSMSEPGPLWLFALLAGAALGVRQPSVAGQRRRTAVAAVALGVCVVGWLVAALFVWVPVAQAEDAARRAAVELAARDDKGNAPFGAVERAAKLLADARDAVRYNADYPFRAALALRLRPGFNPEVVNQLGLAIKTDPARYEYYRERARYLIETGQASAQADRVRAEFARALALNPNFVAMRLEYADFLASIGDKPGAISQYEAALGYDAQLKANEPKRLGAGEVEAVKRKIAGLRG
ncbi:MAG TPA: hypothetical protein VK986_06545, partial [Tepidisphaeraceae bacterium]|nr:hypothetical protein [Tepidisphaeraceae bacterium]